MSRAPRPGRAATVSRQTETAGSDGIDGRWRWTVFLVALLWGDTGGHDPATASTTGVGQNGSAARLEVGGDSAILDLDEDTEGDPDFYQEGSPFDGLGPCPLEEDLASELEPLLTSSCMPTPGCDGTAKIELPDGGHAAAVLRYGGLLGRRQRAESFLLRQDRTTKGVSCWGVTEGKLQRSDHGNRGSHHAERAHSRSVEHWAQTI